MGNRRFRITISLFLQQYNDLRSRTARGVLIADLCDMIHNNGGRFLKLRNKRWVTLTAKESRTKIGHALRDSSCQQQKASTLTRPRTSSDDDDDDDESLWRATKRQRILFEPIPLLPTKNLATMEKNLVGSMHSPEVQLSTDPAMSALAQLDIFDDDWSSSSDSDVTDDDQDFLELINQLDWGSI